MKSILLMTIVICVLLIILGIVVAVLAHKKRKQGQCEEPDYRTFFIMGVIWFPVGLAMMIGHTFLGIPLAIGLPFFSMGLIYFFIGLAKKDKWKK